VSASALELHVEPASRFAATAADWIAAALEADLRASGHCAIALSGGETPRPVYERLAEASRATRIRWRDVDVFFGDERAVPPGDPESNYGMAMAALLARAPAAASRVHRLEAERPDRDAAAQDYANALPERLDLLILGMGADGHTASLFPGSPACAERVRRVVPVTGPKPPVDRLTITPPVIAAARRVVVLVAGAGKAAALVRALEGPLEPRDVPVQLARGGVWFVDHAAAGRLGSAVP